jgi:hypothetical protein
MADWNGGLEWVDWNGGLEWWTAMVNCNGELEWWRMVANGGLEWRTECRTGLADCGEFLCFLCTYRLNLLL